VRSCLNLSAMMLGMVILSCGGRSHDVGLLQRGKGAREIVEAAQANARLRDLPAQYLEGPPFAAQFAWPGATSPATVTVELQAGREYALICTLRDTMTAPQHAALGMLRVLRVR